ncbi:MAG: hypothetical protein U0667_02950 [Chloroflexota bacterium]
MHETKALEHEAEGLDVRVAGPPPDVEGRPRMLEPEIELAGAELVQRHEGQQQPMLGPDRRFVTVDLAVGCQQSTGGCQPAADHGEPEGDRGVPPEPEGDARRRPSIAS